MEEQTQTQTLYDVLGINSTATTDEIKQAYRRLAMQWHPDRNPGNKQHAEEMFKKISHAYKVLSNSETRKQYDAELAKDEDQQQESESTSSAWTDEGISKDEAEKMFLEQMLDLAFELAGRGYAEATIAKTLIGLDCPETMAKAVAATAVKVASHKQPEPGPNTQSNSGRPFGHGDREDANTPIKDIALASWEGAKPYYEAVIGGKNSDVLLSNEQFNQIKTRIRKLNYLGWKFGFSLAAVVALTTVFLKKTEPIVPILIFIGFGILFGFLLALLIPALTIENRNKYSTGKALRYYLPIFESFHRNSPPSPFFAINGSAFIFSTGWFLVRRMVINALLITIFYIAINIGIGMYISILVNKNPSYETLAHWPWWVIPAVITGIYSNKLYFKHAKKLIQKSIALPQEKALVQLRKAGGTSIWGCLILTALFGSFVAIGIYTKNKEQVEAMKVQAEQQAVEAAQQLAEQRAAEKKAAQLAAQNEARRRYDQTVAELEARHPELNPDSSRFNQALTAEVMRRSEIYLKQGSTADQALRQAVAEME